MCIYRLERDTEERVEAEDGDNEDAILTEADLIEEEDQSVLDYNAGGYTPKLTTPNDLDIDAVIYDPEDDMKKLELARKQVRSFGKVRVGIAIVICLCMIITVKPVYMVTVFLWYTVFFLPKTVSKI